MFEVNEREKRILPSWVMQNLSDLEFSSIYDPFSGNAKFAHYFKKRGFQVITSDILQCNYWWNKAIIENSNVVITDESKEFVLNTRSGGSNIFVDWVDSFFTSEEANYLEMWNDNISHLSISDEEKALLHVAVYMTINYWVSYNKKYFQTKPMSPLEVLQYYMELINAWVFDNDMPNTVYFYDSYDIASQIPTEAVYIYPPSKQGFRNYNMKYYLWECWTRRVKQLNMEGVINKAEYPKLGEVFDNDEDYLSAIDSFLQMIQSNKIWVLAYNDKMPYERLLNLVKNYKNIHKTVEIEIPYPSAAGTTTAKEGIIIAVS